MKKAVMMLAFVGGVLIANAQDGTNEELKQDVKAAMSLTTQVLSDEDQAKLSAMLTKRTTADQVRYSEVKHMLLDRNSNLSNHQKAINYIQSNPTVIDYVNSNEHILHSMGLSKKEINYLKAYLKSNAK